MPAGLLCPHPSLALTTLCPFSGGLQAQSHVPLLSTDSARQVTCISSYILLRKPHPICWRRRLKLRGLGAKAAQGHTEVEPGSDFKAGFLPWYPLPGSSGILTTYQPEVTLGLAQTGRQTDITPAMVTLFLSCWERGTPGYRSLDKVQAGWAFKCHPC